MADKKTCDHAEGKLLATEWHDKRGVLRRAAPGWEKAHNCDYVDARNALIPTAERRATERVAKSPELGNLTLQQRKNTALWSRTFLEEMDKLWRERNSN